MPEGEEYYTPDELAEHLKVTRRTVYQWLADGKLKALKAGKGWRISKAAVKAFLEGSGDQPQ